MPGGESSGTLQTRARLAVRATGRRNLRFYCPHGRELQTVTQERKRVILFKPQLVGSLLFMSINTNISRKPYKGLQTDPSPGSGSHSLRLSLSLGVLCSPASPRVLHHLSSISPPLHSSAPIPFLHSPLSANSVPSASSLVSLQSPCPRKSQPGRHLWHPVQHVL